MASRPILVARGAVAAGAALLVGTAMTGSAAALPNPASVFCAQSGGRSEILRTAGGAEIGICVLAGGQIVEEWAYYRAHHPPAATGR
jgi:uncharacterized protein